MMKKYEFEFSDFYNNNCYNEHFFFHFRPVEVLTQVLKSTISQSKTLFLVENSRLRPWWKVSSLSCWRNMILGNEVRQYKQHAWDDEETFQLVNHWRSNLII